MGLIIVNKKSLAVEILLLLALSSIIVYRAMATSSGPSLPPPNVIVTIEVVNGTSSYFSTTLSNIPSGYDVTNATYLGWCVDTTAEMSRSPATHDVILYSSLNLPNGTLADQRWDMVNYVLNHKQGTAGDVQAAIWYFVNFDNGTITPSGDNTVAWAIINDALANGTGYVPASGQIVAVICDPILLLPRPAAVQINIIEVSDPIVPEYPTLAISLLGLAGVSIALVYGKKTFLPRH